MFKNSAAMYLCCQASHVRRDDQIFFGKLALNFKKILNNSHIYL